MAAETKTVYGVNEKVLIEDFNLKVEAKLDTGADTASLSARDIEVFERDGKQWARFVLAIEGASGEVIERLVKRVSKIKRRAADVCDGGKDDKKTKNEEESEGYTARPVIELQVCMGKKSELIEVNLTDRSSFKYPFLVGTKALKRFGAVVDPAEQFMMKDPSCDKKDKGAK